MPSQLSTTVRSGREPVAVDTLQAHEFASCSTHDVAVHRVSGDAIQVCRRPTHLGATRSVEHGVATGGVAIEVGAVAIEETGLTTHNKQPGKKYCCHSPVHIHLARL